MLEIDRDSGHYDAAQLVKVLIAAGAEINTRNDEGNRPRRLAENQDHAETAAVLLAHGAKK